MFPCMVKEMGVPGHGGVHPVTETVSLGAGVGVTANVLEPAHPIGSVTWTVYIPAMAVVVLLLEPVDENVGGGNRVPPVPVHVYVDSPGMLVVA